MRQDERPVIPAEFWHALFRARSIAVIGASDVTGSWGYDIMNAALASARSKGRHVFPVNPNLKEVLGQKAYPTILDIPEAVELAIIAVPARIVPQVFRQCAEKGVKAAVIITAGFAEVDSAGAKLQEEIVAIAREHNLHFTGPNCVGHADMHSRLASISFATTAPAGSMALVSQSGTLGASILLMAISRGIGISKFVSTGNEADLHLEDYLEYLARDEETKIIALYIEGLRQGRRFYELARKTTPQKPILAIKSGGTSAAAQAVRSHTGALAGSDAVYSAAFRQSGVIRVQDEEELCDTALALLRLPLPRGRRVGILTIGGGFGVMTAELCEKEGLEIAPLEERTLKAMAAVLPPRWTPGNPVDLVGVRPTGGDKTGDECLKLLLEDKNVDIVISLLPPLHIPPGMMQAIKPEEFKAMREQAEKNQAILYEKVREYGKPLVYIRRLSLFYAPEPSKTEALKTPIPEYSHPRRAARVLSYLAKYQRYLAETTG